MPLLPFICNVLSFSVVKFLFSLYEQAVAKISRIWRILFFYFIKIVFDCCIAQAPAFFPRLLRKLYHEWDNFTYRSKPYPSVIFRLLFRISSKICKFPIEGISFCLALSKRNKMKKLYDTIMGNLGKGLTLRMKHKENPWKKTWWIIYTSYYL